MSGVGYPAVPELESNADVHRRKLAVAVNRLNEGKSNCTLDVPITPNAATTDIEDVRISYFCAICAAMAFSAAGAADIAAGFYVTNLKNGSATLNHRNNAASRTIRFLILG